MSGLRRYGALLMRTSAFVTVPAAVFVVEPGVGYVRLVAVAVSRATGAIGLFDVVPWRQGTTQIAPRMLEV